MQVSVLVVCDAVDSANPDEVAEGIRLGWLANESGSSTALQVRALGLSRGGRGFCAAAARLAGARTEPVALAEVLATVVLLPDGTAILEAAQVTSGRSSHPLGLLMQWTVARPEVGTLIVGVGDLTCLDGGLGMLQALAGRADDPNESDLGWVADVRQQWLGRQIIAATAESLPLLGFHGAASYARESLGLDGAQSQAFENRLGQYVDHLRRVLPSHRDLLTGKERRLDRESGAGAGGGVGYALAVLGAQLRPGPQLFCELADVDHAIAQSELVVMGADVFDWKSLQDTVISEVGARAARSGKPVVVLSYEAHIGRRESAALGVSGVYSVVPAGRMASNVSTGGASEPVDGWQRSRDLAMLATRVARTWTPS